MTFGHSVITASFYSSCC